MPGLTTVSLGEDTVDDLLYCARAGELDELKQDLSALSSQHNASLLAIAYAVIDPHTGNTLAHYACANGHLDIIKYLISLATSTTSTTPSTTDQESPSTPPELLSYLTKANDSLSTPLHYAALNDQLPAIKLLLEAIPTDQKSAFVGAKNASGRDAAFEAESAGKEEVVTFLLGVMDETELQPAGADDETMDDGEDAEQGGGVDVKQEKDLEQTTSQVEKMKVDD